MVRQAAVTVALTGVMATVGACAQAATTPPLATQASPPAAGAVTYDAARHVLLLVTAGSPARLPMQTWTWDGRRWTRQRPSVSPSLRTPGPLAFDPVHHVALLQGGIGANGPTLTDSWQWNGSTWSRLKPVHSPDAVQQPGQMAYDVRSRRMILYQWPHQTWSWDGTDWRQLQPAHVPDIFGGTLVPDGQHLLLTGSPTGNNFETWVWSGSDWILKDARHVGEMIPGAAAFDSEAGQVNVFGGGPGDDTWTWDGTTWHREHPAHSPGAVVAELTDDPSLKGSVGFAVSSSNAITGTYLWNGHDWSAIGSGTPAVVAAGSDVHSIADAEAIIHQRVTNARPVLLPTFPPGLDQAVVTADVNGFDLRVMSDDRLKEVDLSVVVLGNSNGAAANKQIQFRGADAYYQYMAGDPSGWRDLSWIERPGHWPSQPALKGADGMPYLLSSNGLTEAQFFALAGSLR